jgi:hypothetical protein
VLWTRLAPQAGLRRTVSILLLLALIGWGFTKYVVLWKDPLLVQYAWHPEVQVLRVSIANMTTDDDYRDVDLHFSLNEKQKDIFVINTRQRSQLATCSMFLDPSANGLPGDVAAVFPDRVVGSYQRTRCEVLPHASVLEVDLLLGQGDHLAPLSAVITNLKVEGSYRGKFRVFKVPSSASLITQHFRGWAPGLQN